MTGLPSMLMAVAQVPCLDVTAEHDDGGVARAFPLRHCRVRRVRSPSCLLFASQPTAGVALAPGPLLALDQPRDSGRAEGVLSSPCVIVWPITPH